MLVFVFLFVCLFVCFFYEVGCLEPHVGQSFNYSNCKESGEHGWRSGENTRLPPMWPGFDSRTRRHKWALLILLSTPRGFSPGTPLFPSPKNQHLI